MGHKVNPHGARVGVIFDWSTRWYAGKKEFADNLNEDFRLRKMLKEKYNAAGISRIDIERSASRMTVTLFAGKPGMVIGRSGKGIDEIRADVEKFCGHAVNIRVLDVKNPDADAQLIAENIAQQPEKRIGFRRAMPARHEAGRQGRQDRHRRPRRRRRNRPYRKIPRGFHPSADPARQHRLRLLRSENFLRPSGREGVGVQGRGSPQAQEGRAARCRDRRRQVILC